MAETLKFNWGSEEVVLVCGDGRTFRLPPGIVIALMQQVAEETAKAVNDYWIRKIESMIIKTQQRVIKNGGRKRG